MLEMTEKAEADVTAPITVPFWLVELEMATATYRWSSRHELDWNGHTWAQSGVQVDTLRDLAGGAQEGTISLPNHDRAASALVLAERINGRPVRIWKLYGQPPYAVGDAILKFSGVADGTPNVAAPRVSIEINGVGLDNQEAPRLLWDLFSNHIPPAGSVISWAGEHFLLERRG